MIEGHFIANIEDYGFMGPAPQGPMNKKNLALSPGLRGLKQSKIGDNPRKYKGKRTAPQDPKRQGNGKVTRGGPFTNVTM